MINKIKKKLKSKLVKNSIWLTILQLINTVVPMLTIPYITRILGPSQYGVFSIALNWVLYFQVLVEFGFGLSGARKAAIISDSNELQKTFNNIISSRIILLAISFLLLNVVALISSFNKETYNCMLLLFIMIIGVTFQLTWLFQGKQDMKFITLINSISRIISTILIFIFVREKSDIYLYCILYSLTLLISSVISLIIAYKKYNLKFKFSSVKNIRLEINDAKYLFASSAMTKIFSGFGITILGYYTTTEITGIYSAIYKIPYVLTMFFSPISQALYPYISQKFEIGMKEGIDTVKHIAPYVVMLFLIPSVIIVVLNNCIINFLFGADYSKYSIVIVPLIIQFIIAMINNFLGIQILVASGKQKDYSRALIFGGFSTFVLNIIMGKMWNIYGVSFAVMIGEFLLMICLILSIKKGEN